MIAIIINFNILYANFNITITSFLETDNKTVNKIQSILQSKKTKNINRQANKKIIKLAITFKNNKRKAISYDKYFNCYKLGYFEINCT